MNAQRRTGIALWLGGMALVLGIGTVIGEQAPPTESKGVQISPPEALDLTPWAARTYWLLYFQSGELL